MLHSLEERHAPTKSDCNKFCFYLKVQSANLLPVETPILHILLAAASLYGDYKSKGAHKEITRAR